MEGTSVETYQHIPPSINGLRVSPSVGELTAPDSHYRPVLFSPLDAQREHKQLNKDVYEQSQPYKPKKKKIPTAVWVIAGAICAITLLKLIRKIIKK